MHLFYGTANNVDAVPNRAERSKPEFTVPNPASSVQGGVQMYAIIETGSKQYKVKEGDVIKVEKLNVESGEKYQFDSVLAYVNDDNMTFGSPYIEGAKVEASVLEQGRDKKVIVYKYKSKKGFHKKKGHRQPFTKLKIDAISC